MSKPPSFTPPPGARAHRLRTARGEFAVVEAPARDTGRARGTVLLLPGYTGSKEDFSPLQGAFAAAGYRSVAVDGRGQYESPGDRGDESGYARKELALDVVAQVDALGDGPVHLLGHSLGGQIARAAVLLDPRPFRSLTLMASGPAEISVPQQERVRLLREALAVMTMEEVWEAMQAMQPPLETEADLDEGLRGGEDLRRRWLLTSPAQLLATGLQLCVEPDRTAELAAVPLPKHVLSGERDDTWPVPLFDEMAVRLDAHRTVVRGAEHSPNTDQPEVTARALIAFWDANSPGTQAEND